MPDRMPPCIVEAGVPSATCFMSAAVRLALTKLGLHCICGATLLSLSISAVRLASAFPCRKDPAQPEGATSATPATMGAGEGEVTIPPPAAGVEKTLPSAVVYMQQGSCSSYLFLPHLCLSPVA